MAQAPSPLNRADEVKRHIEREREVLGTELQHLEHRVRSVADQVRSAADWHTWLDRKPLLFVGLAFAGGLYLSGKIGK